MSDDIKDKIDLIAEESITKISKSKNLNELEDLRIFYLGKKGLVTSFLKTMKDLEQSEKINIGKKLNLLKNKLINNIEVRMKKYDKHSLRLFKISKVESVEALSIIYKLKFVKL